MVEVWNSIMANDVWEVVPSLEDMSVVGFQWIYKVNYATNGIVEKYTTMFMGKGYAKKEGIKYKEAFALVSQYIFIEFFYISNSVDGMENSPDGHQDILLE